MCNLFHQATTSSEVNRLFRQAKLSLSESSRGLNIESGYVGADQDGPVIINGSNGDSEIVTRRWGFPSIRDGAKPITNIRNLESKWWKNVNGKYLNESEYRCLVPFDRFAEWDASNKRNAWFTIDAEQPFFAGIWRPWNGERLAHVEGKKRRERRIMDWNLFAFLTTSPNETVAAIHPKAMPVILTTASECETWLGGGMASLELQRPLPDAIVNLAGSS